MTLVRVLSATEPWAEYQLDDGTLLRFRLTACGFRRTGKLTDLGDPEYSFTHAMQIETHAGAAAPIRTSPKRVTAGTVIGQRAG